MIPVYLAAELDPGVVQISLAVIALLSTIVGAIVTIITVNRRGRENVHAVRAESATLQDKGDQRSAKLDKVADAVNGQQEKLRAEIAALKAELAKRPAGGV